MIAGIDLREVTGDTISKEDYIAAQGEVWPCTFTLWNSGCGFDSLGSNWQKQSSSAVD